MQVLTVTAFQEPLLPEEITITAEVEATFIIEGRR